MLTEKDECFQRVVTAPDRVEFGVQVTLVDGGQPRVNGTVYTERRWAEMVAQIAGQRTDVTAVVVRRDVRVGPWVLAGEGET